MTEREVARALHAGVRAREASQSILPPLGSWLVQIGINEEYIGGVKPLYVDSRRLEAAATASAPLPPAVALMTPHGMKAEAHRHS